MTQPHYFCSTTSYGTDYETFPPSNLITMELQFVLEGPQPCTILYFNVHTRRTILRSRPKTLRNKCITKTFVRLLIFQLTRFSFFFSKLVAALIVTGESGMKCIPFDLVPHKDPLEDLRCSVLYQVLLFF